MLLNEMEMFYYIVEYNSFSQAARRLGVSKSFISKRINNLERTLKSRLLSRSTRKLTLTEAGENFYQACANVVREGGKGYSVIQELQGKPVGILKVSIPPTLALNLLTPLLVEFVKRYPEVNLDIELETQLVDLIKEGYDLALRSAKLISSNLISQKIFTIHSYICATKEYLKTYGTPKNPEDLTQHNCATYSQTSNLKQIKLMKNNQTDIIHLQGNFTSNNLSLIKDMVLGGTCLAVLPEFMITKELSNKKLIRCLTNYQLPTQNLYAIYPEKELMLPKVKYFLEMLKAFLAEF